MGEGSPYAILRYICHRGASDVHQMDSDILDNHPGYRLVDIVRWGVKGASGEGGGNGGDRGLCKEIVRFE